MRNTAEGYELGKEDLLKAQVVNYIKKSQRAVPEKEVMELFFPDEVSSEMLENYIRRFMSDKIEIRPDGTCVLKEKSN